ncbi:MAG: SAM-dependent chlorinase/fluorinase [Desulfobacterales bacterium]
MAEGTRVISLLTDFGLKDEYVGVVKGVILSISPDVRIIDITHAIDPQDIVQASFIIEAAYRYFPEGTVHVIVVDPGVGGERMAVAVQIDGHTFVAPDNGVLGLLLEGGRNASAVSIDNDAYFLSHVSTTFHGRDIFAPVAAHVSAGLSIKRLGRMLRPADLAKLAVKRARIENDHTINGVVIATDRFGNLLTNIGGELLDHINPAAVAVSLNGREINGLSTTYGSVKKGAPLSVIGSRGYLEISVNFGSAANYFEARKGDRVKVVM